MDKRCNNHIVIGLTSKLTILVFKYPWLAMLLSFFVLEIIINIIGISNDKLVRSLIILPLFSIITFIVWIFTKSWCYKIEINSDDNSIIFYKFFNRGVEKFIMNNMSIVVGCYCNIYIDKSRFIIHDNFIHDLVQFLPRDTPIEYIGRIGKHKEKEWEKYNRPLIPGKRSQN